MWRHLTRRLIDRPILIIPIAVFLPI